MAGRAEIKCIGPSGQLGDRKAAVQRSINCFINQSDVVGEDIQLYLQSVPGLSLLATMAGKIRGSYNADGRWFVVAGSVLYEVTTAGIATSRGTLSSASGFVCMIRGRDQLVLVDGASGYVFSLLLNTFSNISSPNFRGSVWVAEIDGYFVFSAPGTDQFYISKIDDATSFMALDHSSADTRPDDIITFRIHRNEILIFGSISCEVWINSGDGDANKLPFVRYNSTPIDVGIVGNRAAAIAGDSIYFVGATERGRGYMYEMRGHQPTRVSTQPVEEAIKASTDITQCRIWSYHVVDAEFIGVWAPGMPTIWVFDLSTRQWHERAEYVNGAWVPLRAEFITFVDGNHYALGGAGVYLMSSDLYTIAEAPLIRERTWPHLMAPSMEPVTYRGLELACTTGGEVAGNITLECSNDGGFTWTAPRLKSLGATGRYMQRVRWMPLGAARDRVFRLRCSDAVPLNIHSAAVDA